MDPGACLSCRRCKCKSKLHEKSETARRTRYVVKPCRQCSHRNSCDACARSDGRMSCKHGSCQRRCSRYRSDSSDTSHCKEERLSGKNNSRSQSSYSRSSSLESGYGSDGSFWMNSNFMFRCPHSIAGKKEEQIHKKSLASSSRRYIHTSSTRIHKHRYSHKCPRIKRSCHGLHCCHNKKRHHENYSSDSDDSRKRHEFSSCRHRNRSHGLGPVGSHEICHLKKPEDITHCSPNSMGVKEELISKAKGFMTGVCIASEDHNVEGSNVGCIEHIQMPFGWEKGSLIINREQNGAMAHCPIGKEKTEKQEHLDEWLQLSLKTSPRTNLIVEGISKSDFKLSLPEVEEHLNVRDYFHSGPSEIKELNINSIQFSAIDFPASSPRLDPFLYYQPRENLDYITVLPDLNLPPHIANGCHGISIPAKWANSRLELHDNCHNSHVKEELRCTLLNQRWNWAYSDHEEKCCVSEHAVLPNWLVENSTSHTRIPVIGNEELMGVHIGDSHIKASSISGAADYSHFNDRSFHFSAKTEALADLIIILDDSEDEWSKQNASRSLPGQHNVFGTCKKSLLPEEISDNHATQVLVHGRNVQGPLSAGNGTEDRVERNIDLRWPFPAHSTENLGKYSDSMVCLPSNNCSILEISSSENESINNEMADDTPPNNSSLQGTGGEYTPQADLAVPKFDNNTMAGYANYRVDNYFDEGGSIGGFRSKENDFSCKSWSDKDIINIPAVGSSKDTLGTLEHVLIEPECIGAPLHIAKAEVQMWDRGITCDLCGQGPSLMYGKWYAWCCGSCLSLCKCTEEHKRKLLLSMKCKKAKYLKKWNGHKWSGKVHRMCGLWSSEVFEKGDARDRLEGLMDAVRRGRSLLCAECKRFGATLGCRVEKCKRSFHYTCADRISSQLRCRMWEGFKVPVACYHHTHVDHYCMTAKDKTPYVNIKCTTNPVIANGNQHATISSKKTKFEDTISNETVMPTGDLNINNQEEKTPPGVQDDHAMTPCLFNSFEKRRGIDPTIRKDIAGDLKIDEIRSEKARQTSCRKDDNDHGVKYLGENLICEDISSGTEAIKIPCTNDMDNDSLPLFEYILENRFSAPATAVLESVLSNKEKQAKACNGCDSFDIDNPEASISAHVNLNASTRDQDARIDWQGEPMLGRLPYDRCGRLQLGLCSPDVVECNTKCPCGSKCLNRELQNGLKFALEVFKTKDGWSVRSLEQIPRGKLVIEYVGEVLSQNEALERAQMCDQYSLRYLFSMDHPSVPQEDQLVIDIFRMSNLARFFNHSCAGNLSIYRVYTETLDTRIYRLGMYACRDIELGEELNYDYNV